MITAKIILASQSANQHEIYTYVLKYPRFIHPQLMTHRVFSRNVSSSRAIPTEKMTRTAIVSNIRPVAWESERTGMSPGRTLTDSNGISADMIWDDARNSAMHYAQQLSDLGVHKQWANRILEPFLPVTTIVTATDFTNFFNLRLSHEAQGEIQELAEKMLAEKMAVPPTWVSPGEWHIPFIREEEEGLELDTKMRISVARCARVSYKTPDNDMYSTIERDMALWDRLQKSCHWSPFEHQAMALASSVRVANFSGWVQYRQLVDTGWGRA